MLTGLHTLHCWTDCSDSMFGAGQCYRCGPAARGRGCAAQGIHQIPDEGQTYNPDSAFKPCCFMNYLCMQVALLWLCCKQGVSMHDTIKGLPAGAHLCQALYLTSLTEITGCSVCFLSNT